MRTTEFMPQTITNDHHLWLTTRCVPKWTLHWHGSGTAAARRPTTGPAVGVSENCPFRARGIPGEIVLPTNLEANRHTLVTELAESGAGDEVIMSIAGHVSRAMLSGI